MPKIFPLSDLELEADAAHEASNADRISNAIVGMLESAVASVRGNGPTTAIFPASVSIVERIKCILFHILDHSTIQFREGKRLFRDMGEVGLEGDESALFDADSPNAKRMCYRCFDVKCINKFDESYAS